MRPFKFSLLLTALVLALGALVPAATATTRTPWRVTAFTATTNISGQGLLIHGRVFPNARGRHVRIEYRNPGQSTWLEQRLAFVHKDSTYAARIFLFGPGVHQVRVVMPAGGGHRRGVSRVRLVDVYDWTPLETKYLDVPQDSLTSVEHNYTVGSRTFGLAYVQDPQGDRFFALNGRCKRLDVWAAADPSSATDDDSAALVLASRKADPSSYSDNLAHPLVHKTGTPVHIQLGPDMVPLIVNLQLYFNGFVSGNKVVWGNPRALCDF